MEPSRERPPSRAADPRWILPALAATLVLSGVIAYVVSHPRGEGVPGEASAAPTTPASHVDFVQPRAAPAKEPWIQVPLPVNVPLHALTAGVDVTYAAGDNGTVLRRRRAEDVWSQEKTPTDEALYGIAIQLDHVVAVGERGTIVDLPSQSAGEFHAVPSGTNETLRAVAFSSLGAVAAGDHGTLLLSTAGAWTAQKSGTTQSLRAVCAGLQTIVVVGDHGTVVRRDGERWVLEEPGTTADLHGVSCDDRRVVAVGTGGVVVLRDEPHAAFEVRKMGANDLFAVDAYYGTSSWLAVGRDSTLLRGTGTADSGGLHGDLHAVEQGSMGTFVAGESGLFLDARAQ